MSEPIFIDTSALYAVLDRDDERHDHAARIWSRILDEIGSGLRTAISHHGVAIETTALVQRRLGIPAVRMLHDLLLPIIDIRPIEATHYERAVTALLAAAKRDVSLVDWLSFELMRRHGVRRAMAFDDDFAEQGFDLAT